MSRGDRRLPGKLKVQLQRKSAARRSRNTKATALEASLHRRGRKNLQPVMKSVFRPIDALKPVRDRPRKTLPEQVQAVIRSVQQFGIILPILIDEDDTIVSGQVLREAAK